MPYEFIHSFPALSHRFGVEWDCHVHIYLINIRACIVDVSVRSRSDLSLIGLCLKCILDIGTHPHLLLEVHLGERIVVLSILDFFVSLVNQMVASRDVVVPVVFDTL